MKHPRLLAFIIACALAGAWAFFLIGKHYDAEAQLLQPGLLCGEGGGCGAVLGSDYSTFAGVPVSAPAVPMYLMLALFGVMALRGSLDRDKVAGIATLCGLGGVAFGGYLLWAMLIQVGEVCRYCLIMDGLNLLVLGLGASLHTEGLVGGLKKIPASLSLLGEAVPGIALMGAVLGGTLILHLATQGQAGRIPEVAETTTPAPSSPTPAPKAATAPATPPKSTPARAGVPPKPGSRRVVLQADVADIPIDASVPTKGPADAPVTIVTFEDFQCPFCKKLSGNLEIVKEELGDEVRLAFMHFPMQQACNANELKKSMHRNACTAAAASVCAQDQGKFWEMHDLLFRNNNKLGGRALMKYAKEIGLDVRTWRACVEDKGTLDKIKRDSKIGGDAKVGGTPTFFINGRKLVGAQPVEAIKAAIESLKEEPDGRVLLDVELTGEIIGPVEATASSVGVAGPDGEFTIDAFEASIEDGKARSTPGVAPARSVTWYEADAACKAVGKRLCTEGEWLSACTGEVAVDVNNDGVYSKDPLVGRQHVYGEHYREGWCADTRKKGEGLDLLTGNHPRCGTPEGVYDLEGSMKEWVGLTPDRAALKGGSYYSGSSARCAYFKDDTAPDTKDESIGFRCCTGEAEVASAETRYPGGKVGDSILVWSQPKKGGGTLGNDDLEGKPYIMTFWASWCGPCKKELPALAELYAEYQSRGLEIIGVNVDRNREAADRYLAANPLPFPVVYDTSNGLMDRFDTRGVPTTFWVQPDGTIRQRSIGYDENKGMAKLQADANALLAK
ncbi:MAG: thioredoxin domain-containing protein [Deltaproteobacteria bacterium]|nr:thioredoxin domain-containing protein [Deltaproteobacteria bacterium]